MPDQVGFRLILFRVTDFHGTRELLHRALDLASDLFPAKTSTSRRLMAMGKRWL